MISDTLIRELCQPRRYPHATSTVEVLETHISWLLLTGSYVYKIKKPVDLGFVDFSTLEKRKHFCEEELRLNRRFAPDLYLQVLPITGSANDPHLGGSGEAIEFAVQMVQFPAKNRLDAVLQRGELLLTDADRLAETIAEGHAAAAVAPASSEYGQPAACSDKCSGYAVDCAREAAGIVCVTDQCDSVLYCLYGTPKPKTEW